jgi:hypothetical protein
MNRGRNYWGDTIALSDKRGASIVIICKNGGISPVENCVNNRTFEAEIIY